MTCPNIKIRMVKLHDTKFYCCDKFKDLESWGCMDCGSPYGFNYCPYCGGKIR